MRVHIRSTGYGRESDIYFVEERHNREAIMYWRDGIWVCESIDEGSSLVMPPTFQLTDAALVDLRDALQPSGVQADAELVRRLQLEETRVDKMLQSVLTIAERRI